MKVLVTGGAGWIGSTVCYACADSDIPVVVIDDLSTGKAELVQPFPLYVGDIADASLVHRIIDDHPDISHVVHCAASIIVPESTQRPLDYWSNNVAGTIRLLQILVSRNVSRFVFSSSASIYAATDGGEVAEDAPIDGASPYARTKATVERLLADVAAAGMLRTVSLRYFNPVGADPALRTGQPNPEPSHVLGRILSAALHKTPFVITGTDWPTRDGTGLRDYVHIWDLARAHVLAIREFDRVTAEAAYLPINLGSGHGTTVRELIAAARDVLGDFVVREGPRRPGDVAGAAARIDRARRLLGWEPKLDIRDAIRDALRWIERRRELLGY